MPNFLVIGAAKSGTTSLYHYLKQHPQVYMSSIKEPGFFAFEGTEPRMRRPWRAWISRNRITDIESYQALFQGVSDEIAIGEASPAYLVRPRAVERIKHYIPDAKLIAMLRNPVERAYSAFLMQGLCVGDMPEDSGQAMCELRQRRSHLDAGFYYAHLKRYFDNFDRAQIGVYLFDDFEADPVEVTQEIFRFLGVDETFVPDTSVKHVVGGLPRNKLWGAIVRGLVLTRPILRPFVPVPLRQRSIDFISNLQRRGLAKPSPLDPETRRELIQEYQQDILSLQELIQRDLSDWLE